MSPEVWAWLVVGVLGLIPLPLLGWLFINMVEGGPWTWGDLGGVYLVALMWLGIIVGVILLVVGAVLLYWWIWQAVFRLAGGG